VDGWGNKFTALLLVPLVIVGMYLLMLVLPLIDPGRANYQNFPKAYNVIRVAILTYMSAIYVAMLAAAFGYKINMTSVILPLVGVLFIVLGNFLGKIRPNWFMGIRTPWTLSSQLSWDKTHRVGGWLFILMGLLFFPVALMQTTWSLVAMLVIDACLLGGLIVYSYLVYRSDPQRTSPAGTLPQADQ
jgi:uncharacterized membrane protein